jgi:hypothetical protein
MERLKVFGAFMTVFFQAIPDVENDVVDVLDVVRVELQFAKRQAPETVRVIEDSLDKPVWHGVARVSGLCAASAIAKLRDAFNPVSIATIPLKKQDR